MVNFVATECRDKGHELFELSLQDCIDDCIVWLEDKFMNQVVSSASASTITPKEEEIKRVTRACIKPTKESNHIVMAQVRKQIDAALLSAIIESQKSFQEQTLLIGKLNSTLNELFTLSGLVIQKTYLTRIFPEETLSEEDVNRIKTSGYLLLTEDNQSLIFFFYLADALSSQTNKSEDVKILIKHILKQMKLSKILHSVKSTELCESILSDKVKDIRKLIANYSQHFVLGTKFLESVIQFISLSNFSIDDLKWLCETITRIGPMMHTFDMTKLGQRSIKNLELQFDLNYFDHTLENKTRMISVPAVLYTWQIFMDPDDESICCGIMREMYRCWKKLHSLRSKEDRELYVEHMNARNTILLAMRSETPYDTRWIPFFEYIIQHVFPAEFGTPRALKDLCVKNPNIRAASGAMSIMKIWNPDNVKTYKQATVQFGAWFATLAIEEQEGKSIPGTTAQFVDYVSPLIQAKGLTFNEVQDQLIFNALVITSGLYSTFGEQDAGKLIDSFEDFPTAFYGLFYSVPNAVSLFTQSNLRRVKVVLKDILQKYQKLSIEQFAKEVAAAVSKSIVE